MKHRAIWIDAENQKITDVEVDSKNTLAEMKKFIDCRCVDVVRLGTMKDLSIDLWVDDEGLLTGKTKGFEVQGYPRPLMGNGLIMGGNVEGESVSCPVPAEMVERDGLISFVDFAENPDEAPQPEMHFFSGDDFDEILDELKAAHERGEL